MTFVYANAPSDVDQVITRIHNYGADMKTLGTAARGAANFASKSNDLQSKLRTVVTQAERSASNGYRSALADLRRLKGLVTAKEGENVYPGFGSHMRQLLGLVSGRISQLPQVTTQLQSGRIDVKRMKQLAAGIAFTSQVAAFKNLLSGTILKRQRDHVGVEQTEMEETVVEERQRAAAEERNEQQIIEEIRQLGRELEAWGKKHGFEE